MKNNNMVVTAIDIDFGFCKFLKNEEDSGGTVASMFPSVAFKDNGQVLRGEAYSTVFHAGEKYNVCLNASQSSENYNQDISEIEHISVLIKAALKQMRTEFIELLVFSAPVSILKEMCDQYVNEFTGMVVLDHDKSVFIKKVIVFARGVGAIAPYQKNTKALKLIPNKINCVISCGFVLTDILFLNNKFEPMNGYSLPVGIGHYYADILSSLSIEENSVKILNDIAQFFSSKKQVYINGELVDIKSCVSEKNETILRLASKLSTNVKDKEKSTIANLLVVGNGAKTFLQQIEKSLKPAKVVCPNESVFNEVIGLKMLGEDYIYQRDHGQELLTMPPMRVHVKKDDAPVLFDYLAQFAVRKRGAKLKELATKYLELSSKQKL